MSRDAFGATTEDMPAYVAGSGYGPFEVPSKIGPYRIGSAYQLENGVLFYEKNGSSFVVDGGFAYLPAGPRVLLEGGPFGSVPVLQHLGGPWYAWTSFW